MSILELKQVTKRFGSKKVLDNLKRSWKNNDDENDFRFRGDD